ncbi:MAG: hypothetical protein DRG20_06815 [Deltaproteobacteria bacterium]|nr:MAG: hypothetical protein DRG20_06815 [Deltaproteobacteria bacterium]
MKKKRFLFIISLFLSISIIHLCFASNFPIKGDLKREYGLLILHLKGKPFEIGYAYGSLIKKETLESINFFTEQYTPSFMRFPPLKWVVLHFSSIFLVNRLFESDREMLKGGSKVLGISYPELLLGALAFDLEVASHNCSGVIALGDATSDHNIIHGRNFDFLGQGVLDKNRVVAFIREEGKFGYVTIGSPITAAGTTTGMNEKGLSIQLNWLDTKDNYFFGKSIPSLLRKILTEADSVEDAIKIIKGNNRMRGAILIICDREKGVVVELSSKVIGIRYPKKGILFATNVAHTSEIAPLMKWPMDKNPNNKFREKRFNLIIKKYYGHIDVKSMVNILRDHRSVISQQDVLDGLTINSIRTTHSVIFEPKKLKFWVAIGKAPVPYNRYISFDLKKELSSIPYNHQIIPADKFTTSSIFIDGMKGIKLMWKADKAVRRKKYDKAIKLYMRSLKFKGFDHARIFLKIGNAFLLKKDLCSAEKYIIKAMSTFSEYMHIKPVGLLLLGKIADLQKQREKAISFYKEAIKAGNSFPSVIKLAKEYIDKPYQ